jgi:serine/threonine protein kinase
LNSHFQVLLDEHGNAKVADFGIASAVDFGDETTRTHRTTGVACGTRCYMAFEYISQKQVSEKTDAYAFGIVLLELLTGMPPSDVALKYSLEGRHRRCATTALPPPPTHTHSHCIAPLLKGLISSRTFPS